MHVANLDELEPFITLDGSSIRELAGPAWTPAREQSLAEATVPVGGATAAHYHRTIEELYYIVAGAGTEHKLTNTGADPLVLLCCCAPPYSDEDTVLTEPAA
jgi:mannose-6-phosphate isomerase-like protein (cupin superfamily)